MGFSWKDRWAFATEGKKMTILLWNIEDEQLEFDRMFPIHDALNLYDEITEQYERTGLFLVNERNNDGTIIREFASKENGHVVDLILTS